MRLKALCSLASGIIVFASSPVTAQPVRSTPPSPMRVALVLRDGRQASTEVVRRAKRGPKNVVLVGKDASAEDLAAALRLMSALRMQYGDELLHDIRAHVQTSARSPEWAASNYRLWLIEQLNRLKAAPRRPVGDLGVAQAVLITLPARTATITYQSKGKK